MDLKRTKIVATLGPASSTEEVIKEMYDKGLNVCRLNFSHGDHSIHEENIKRIKAVNQELNANIAVLADLQGPKLRVGVMENEGCEIKTGDKITFTNEECIGTSEKVYMTYQNFAQDVKPGELILIDEAIAECDEILLSSRKDVSRSLKMKVKAFREGNKGARKTKAPSYFKTAVVLE